MQIKLKELLENMTSDGGPPAAAPENTGDDGVVEETVEDGPSVASACPPTPRRSNSSIQKAIDAAGLDEESLAQADFFNPPRSTRRNTPPPPPPRREDELAVDGAPADAISEQPTAPAARGSVSSDDAHGEDEYEPQTFSPGMLSPLSRRPPSGIIDPPAKPPKRDSGLIDVRSMAAAYREYDGLVKKKIEDGGRGADVETVPLPILGASEHTSPILLPQSSAQTHASKWLYVLVALLGAIVVIGSTVAITALILKRRDSGSRSFAALAPDERAALCEAEAEASRIRDDESIAAARRAPAPVPGTVSENEGVTAADVAGTASVPAAALPVSSTSSSSKSKEDDDHHHHSSHDQHGDDSSSSSSSSSSPSTATAAATPPAPAPTPAPSKPAASDDLASAAGSAASSSGSEQGEKCDEVECLVSGRGCCGKSSKGAGAKSDAPPPDPNLPARPERADISSGIASVQGRLQSCGDRHSVRGAVTVKISIAPSGEVKSASTSTGAADFQSCISGAIKGAKFPATQQGARVSYPVMLK